MQTDQDCRNGLLQIAKEATTLEAAEKKTPPTMVEESKEPLNNNQDEEIKALKHENERLQ